MGLNLGLESEGFGFIGLLTEENFFLLAQLKKPFASLLQFIL